MNTRTLLVENGMKIKNFLVGNWLILTIMFIAASLRLCMLASVPPSLTPDEAALGYNAYSIFKTGHDEYGKLLPIIFKSFGDYKPGLYVYLTIPSVILFGLSEFSTRLPSALAGILSVFVIYLIVNKLFSKRLATFSALVAATNPWLIYFSRGAWEANVSLALTLVGIYLFLKSFDKTKLLFLSSLAFALTLITYQGAKLSTSLVVLILLIVFWKEFKGNFILKNFRTTLISVFIGLVISAPIILSLFNGQIQRLGIYSVFTWPRPEAQLTPFLAEGGERVGDISYYLFHSETFNFVRVITGKWFNNFSGKFLFFEGDWANPVSSAPYQGMLLLSDIFLLPIGIFVILKRKLGKGELFFLLWLLLAPLPVALSRDEVNAVRDLNLAIPLVVVLGLGLDKIISWINLQRFSLLFYSLISIIYILGFTYFLDAYFVHLPAHNSNYWRYGYKELFDTIVPLEPKYKDIIVEQSFNQPYIYFLFYQAMENPQTFNPNKYQIQEKLVNSQYVGDVGFIEKLDNIQFKIVDLSALRFLHGALVGSSPQGLPPDWSPDKNNFILIREIKYLNNRDTAFKVVESK